MATARATSERPREKLHVVVVVVGVMFGSLLLVVLQPQDHSYPLAPPAAGVAAVDVLRGSGSDVTYFSGMEPSQGAQVINGKSASRHAKPSERIAAEAAQPDLWREDEDGQASNEIPVAIPVAEESVARSKEAASRRLDYATDIATQQSTGPICGGMPAAWLPSPMLAGIAAPVDRRRLFHIRDDSGILTGRIEDLRSLRIKSFATAAVPGGHSSVMRERQSDDSAVVAAGSSRGLKGFTVMGAGCGKSKEYKVQHENDGAGSAVRKNLKPSEQPLVDCIKDAARCSAASRKIARNLPGIRILLGKRGKLKVGGLQARYERCALVGNAGHLSKAHYGRYIDSHSMVVRFNVQKAAEFADFVGDKTTLRVVNHRRSLAMCCRGNWPEAKAGVKSSGMMLWFPAAQREIMSECESRFPDNPRMSLPSGVIKTEVQAMNAMRRDLMRLGFGPFGAWRQMTSGSHAALLFTTLCDSVSLFGFTTYGGNSEGGADQYAAAIMRNATSNGKTKLGAEQKARSGEKWHDWKGEKYVLRLLHAAGLISICSM